MKRLGGERTFVRLALFSGLAALSLLVICLNPGVSLAMMDQLVLGAFVATAVTTVAHLAFMGCRLASRRDGYPEDLVSAVAEVEA